MLRMKVKEMLEHWKGFDSERECWAEFLEKTRDNVFPMWFYSEYSDHRIEITEGW